MTLDGLEGVLDGRYHLEACIGRGGYGSVHRAFDAVARRHVAIKVLHTAMLLDPVAISRFEREAAILLSLDHPNIVRAYAFGEVRGEPYLVCELLEGVPLKDLFKYGEPLSLQAATAISLDVLDALAAAHQKGIVHRDIKPSNIFLPKPGIVGPARVIDFGIARSWNRTESEPALTLSGEAIGTPAYLAPEQAYGGQVLPATDLYSFGLVLGEMLAGTRIVDGATSLEMLMKQGSSEPHALPRVVEISPLAPVIRRAISKSLVARFPTAAEMKAAILAVGAPPRGKSSLTISLGTQRIEVVPRPPEAPVSMAAPPPVQAPNPAPAAVEVSPERPGPDRRVLVLLAFIAVVTLALVIVAIRVAFEPNPTSQKRHDDDDASPARPKPTVERPPGPHAPSTPTRPRGFATIDAAELRRRVEGAGYAVQSVEELPSELTTLHVSLEASHGSTTATIELARFVQAQNATALVNASHEDEGVLAADGATVLTVIVDGDHAASQALLDAIR
ncbi:MAG: protein kinase [Polyangiaceae bacterium]